MATATLNMQGRKHTIVCTFDPASPRINAWDIHEWINEALNIPEQEVQLVQIDGIQRQVFIKLSTSEQVIKILQDTKGQATYTYPSGDIFPVTIDTAGMGTKRLRIANLPPEISNEILKDALKMYGKVIDISMERWSKAYRYQVENGIRNVQIVMSKHVPSNLKVAGNRTIVTYDGQPLTCYGCGQEGHIYASCPTRKRSIETRKQPRMESYATVLAHAANGGEGNGIEQNRTQTQVGTKTTKTDKMDGPNTEQSKTDVNNMDKVEQQQHGTDTTNLSPIQMDPPIQGNGDTNEENKDQELMDTENQMEEMEGKYKEDQQQMCGGLQERKREMAQTPTIHKEAEEEEGGKERTMEEKDREVGDTSQPDKEGSPKRNKKLKMDRNAARQQDRSRSVTRRAMNKGKVQ